MTLTTRLLVYFLSMLALVLVGFSTALYLLADNYLHQQVRERRDTVLSTIGSVIESGPEGVEWEPMDRPQSLQFSTFEEQVVWVVADGDGNVVARSPGGNVDQFLRETSLSLRWTGQGNNVRRGMRGPWEAGQQWIHSGQEQVGRSQTKEDERHFRSLSITAGVSLLPMQATLRQLGLALSGLSAAIWIIAFLVGRFVCRQAVLPVQRMAVAAGEINAEDLTQRLPPVISNDELEELNQAFNRLLDRLQQAFEQQKKFTGDASHQLRTPLTAILGQVEVALRRERSGDEYREVLETVRQRTTHLTRMVESLLFLARATAEAQAPSFELLNLTTWLPQHLQTWSEHPRYDDVSCNLQGADPLCILAQPTLLTELIDILLDNACKYSEPGTSITVRSGQSGNQVWVSVEDEGCGLEETELVSIFEPFCRAPEARRRGIEGVGLGLSIAKRLVAVLGGDITARSQPKQGSCFTLLFPMA